jgi:myo-inositol-1(or 4)-monophosphatase
MDLTARLAFTRDLAIQAGQLISNRRKQGKLKTEFKGNIELVTDADMACEKLIKNALLASFPDDAVLAEETSTQLPDNQLNGPLWVVDPIDGTVNYAHGHSMVAVSIAWYENAEARIAVVYNPFMNECFTAIRGQGAWLNDAPIRVGEKTALNRALVATGFPYDRSLRPELIERLGSVMAECADVRRLGSAALDICWVACGRLDAYYESVMPWDSAAAALIAREAGARLGRFAPVPDDALPGELDGRHWLIASPALFEPIRNLLYQSK